LFAFHQVHSLVYLRNVLFSDAAASQTVQRPVMVSKYQTVKDLKQAAVY